MGRSKRATGRRNKAKGKEWEREVARLLAQAGFTDCRRGWADAIDAQCAESFGNFRNEAKWSKNLRLYDYMSQVESDARSGEIPVLWYKKNRRPAYAVVRAEDMAWLLARAFLNE